MQVILHFGQHDTIGAPLRDPVTAGLAQNWNTLLQNGFLLPLLAPKAEAHSLASCLTDVPLPTLTEAGHGELLWRRLPARLHGLQAQIRLLSPKVLIICAPERIAANAGFEAAQALYQILGKVDLHLHIPLDRPDHHLESLIGYWLLEGRTLLPFPQTLTSLTASPYVDFRQIYTPWLSVFPEAKLHLSRRSEQADAFQDLAAFTRLFELPKLSPIPPTQASVPSRAIWDSLRHANRLPGMERKLHSQLVQTFEPMNLPADSEIELFGAKARANLHAAFMPVARELEVHLEDQSFLDDLDDILASRSILLGSMNKQLIEQLPRFRLGHQTAGLRAVRRALIREERNK